MCQINAIFAQRTVKYRHPRISGTTCNILKKNKPSSIFLLDDPWQTASKLTRAVPWNGKHHIIEKQCPCGDDWRKYLVLRDLQPKFNFNTFFRTEIKHSIHCTRFTFLEEEKKALSKVQWLVQVIVINRLRWKIHPPPIYTTKSTNNANEVVAFPSAKRAYPFSHWAFAQHQHTRTRSQSDERWSLNKQSVKTDNGLEIVCVCVCVNGRPLVDACRRTGAHFQEGLYWHLHTRWAREHTREKESLIKSVRPPAGIVFKWKSSSFLSGVLCRCEGVILKISVCLN